MSHISYHIIIHIIYIYFTSTGRVLLSKCRNNWPTFSSRCFNCC